MTTPSLLTSLLTLITVATQDLQSELAAEVLPEPWIDHAALHPWEEGTPSKKYWEARRTLISALGMMTAVVQNPREKHFIDGLSYHKPAAFNFVKETGIADILAAPGVDERVGLPVATIAQLAGTDPNKTERVLRFLCSYHFFQETAPAVFANNKLSHPFKTGQPTGSMPLFWGDIGLRSCGGLSATLRSPMTAHSMLPTDASFSHVFAHGHPAKVLGELEYGELAQPNGHGPAVGTGNGVAKKEHGRMKLFDFLARPENDVPRAAFAEGMINLEIMHGPQGSLDFPWGRFDKEGAVFVDVGASTGHLSQSVLPSLKHVRFVNQDRPETCVQGEQFFAEKFPEMLNSGRVTFQPNDFFTGQPVKGASIYILSNILHIWFPEDVRKILGHLVDAMTPASRLLVIEVVIVPAISQSRSPPPSAEERKPEDVPWPLLKNYGQANLHHHHQSMELISLVNGVSRTLAENVALFEQAGLEFVHVHPLRRHVSVIELKKRRETST